MLPFLKHKQEGSVGEEDQPVTRKHDDDYDMLELVSEELISAIHSKDVKAVCRALRSAHEVCDLEPHAEASHEED